MFYLFFDEENEYQLCICKCEKYDYLGEDDDDKEVVFQMIDYKIEHSSGMGWDTVINKSHTYVECSDEKLIKSYKTEKELLEDGFNIFEEYCYNGDNKGIMKTLFDGYNQENIIIALDILTSFK